MSTFFIKSHGKLPLSSWLSFPFGKIINFAIIDKETRSRSALWLYEKHPKPYIWQSCCSLRCLSNASGRNGQQPDSLLTLFTTSHLRPSGSRRFWRLWAHLLAS